MDWDNTKEKLAATVSNKRFLVIICITLLFILAAVYIYNKSIKPKANIDYAPNKEYITNETVDSGTVDLMFFYTTWCPHCKNALPEWNKFKTKYKDTKINDYKINFLEIDCEQDEGEAAKYDVEGYPTIKLLKGNSVIEYDAKPEYSILKTFVTEFTKS